MKTVNQKCICLLLMCLLSGFMAHQVTGKEMSKEPINLHPPSGWGGGGNGYKSMAIQPAISASIDGSLLYIQCSNPAVDVTICIIQNGVIVYKETIPATDTNYILVNLSNYAEGMYMLDLTNASGGHVYGEFLVQK